MTNAMLMLVFLLLSGAAFAQNDAGQDYCASTIERWTDGQGRSQGWLSICVPDSGRVEATWEPALGNGHFRWADGSPACLFTTDMDGNAIGGGRDLDPRADGEPYLVPEIDAGYRTWLLAPGHCIDFRVPYCSPPRCADWVHPGDEGVF